MRTRLLLVLLAATLTLTASLPSASALHSGDSTRSEQVCNGTVCVYLSVTINADQCAYKPLGTPCEISISGDLSARSLLGGYAVGEITGISTASCGWSVLRGSCGDGFPQQFRASYRGEYVCVSATAFAQDALHVAEVSFTHCYEAH